jgi:RNA polymerase sigma-70 factor (ECF subfamily)
VSERTSDEILMAAYQAGNEPAFRELFDRYAGSVYGFLVRRLGDKALAEDLYQEAFLRLHRARGSYDSSRPFRAWLFSIVHNLLNDALRSRSRIDNVEVTGDGRERPTRHGRAAEGIETSTPENLVATRQSSRALADALSALPADEATVLILARLEGLSYDDIGSVIGRSSAATKQLAYRALKRLRSELTASGHEDPS